MTCDSLEEQLSAGAPLSAEARAHVAGCADCQATAQVLGWAALPDLSEVERQALARVEVPVASRPRPGKAGLRSFASLALAAGLGALVASTVMWRVLPRASGPVEPRTVHVLAPEGADLIELTADVSDADPDDESAFNVSDDVVFDEVGWPSPTEGDL